MSRDLKHIASLNTVGGANTPSEEQRQHEDDLQIFSNTTFFDLDMGRSTDIATTVDELLMQQEKQIQYPHKQQLPDDAGPVAGPSYTSNGQHQQHQNQHQQLHQLPESSVQEEPFDFTTLQGFSLAGELPQASLSLYEVDPVFHEQQHTTSNVGASSTPAPAVSSQVEQLHHRNVTKPPLVQRYEVAEKFVAQPPTQKEVSESIRSSPLATDSPSNRSSSAAPDDEKRKRNTAASARFRIKKKLREQEMEKNHRLMQQKLLEQEDRIKQLEMENSWLKNLVVERNTARDSTALGQLREELMQKGH